jgi:hypothetical protein
VIAPLRGLWARFFFWLPQCTCLRGNQFLCLAGNRYAQACVCGLWDGPHPQAPQPLRSVPIEPWRLPGALRFLSWLASLGPRPTRQWIVGTIVKLPDGGVAVSLFADLKADFQPRKLLDCKTDRLGSGPKASITLWAPRSCWALQKKCSGSIVIEAHLRGTVQAWLNQSQAASLQILSSLPS